MIIIVLIIMKRSFKKNTNGPPSKMTKIHDDNSTIIVSTEDEDPQKPYDVISCHNLIKNQKSFLSDNYTDDCMQILNCIDSEVYNIDRNKLTWKNLQETFEHTGHTMSMSFRYNYSLKLVLDFDYKGNKDDTIGSNEMIAFVKSLNIYLASKFPQIKFNDENIIIMRRNNNMHLYFDINVSCCLYNVIINEISVFDNGFMDNYKIDRIINLPLPFSAKMDKSVYKMVSGVEQTGDFSDNEEFYDFDEYVQTEQSIIDKIMVMEFSIKPIHESAQRLIKVYIDREDMIIKTKHQPLFMKNLLTSKLTKINATSSFFQIVHYVKNVRSLKKLQIKHFSQNTEAENCDDILLHLKSFNKQIDDYVYYSDNDSVDIFLTFVNEFEKYSLYLIFLALIHLSKYIKDDVELLKCRFIDFLLINIKNKTTVYCLHEMKKYSIMKQLIDSFSSVSKQFLEYIIFEYVTKEETDDIYSYLDKIKSYIESTSGGVNLNNCKKIINIICHPIKYENDQCYVYSRNDNYYELVKSLNQSNHFKIINSRYDKKDQAVCKNACISVLMNLKYSVIKFNEYEHFINTQHGVFYTVTGTYLEKTPYLYFNMEKKYCTGYDSFKNDLLIELYEPLEELLTSYINNQNEIFYLTVAVPGLLKLKYICYDKTEASQMWSSIVKVISADINFYKIKHYFAPLIKFVKDYSKQLYIICKIINDNDELVYRQIIDEFTNTTYTNSEETFHVNTIIIAIVTLLIYKEEESDNEDENDVWKINGDNEYILNEFDSLEKSSPMNVEDFYKDTSHLNITNQKELWKAVWSMFFNEELKIMCLDLLFLISTIFKYDPVLISDYLLYTSEIYQHYGAQNHMSIYCGKPRSGKSTLLNIIAEMVTDNALYRTSKDYNHTKSTGGPSPNAIHMKTKYITIINEIESISKVLLKTITGNDGTNDERSLYSTKFPMLKNCTILYAACNSIPKMDMPDEAVRDRMIFFPFNVNATPNCDKEEPNCLLMFSKNITYRIDLNITQLAKTMSTILYVCHKKNKKSNAFIAPITKNKHSLNLIDKFMIKNNYVYYILKRSGIYINPLYNISKNDILKLTESHLFEYNQNSKFKVSPSRFKTAIEEFLFPFYTDCIKMYVGIGQKKLSSSNAINVKEIFANLDIQTDLKYNTKINTLKSKLKTICNDIDVINETIDTLKGSYEYCLENHLLKCVKIELK